jgi:hypothetical protein
VSIGYYEFKKHTPMFNEGYSKSLHHRKQAELQWLQDPSKINRDNLKDVKYDVSRHFGNQKRKHLKDMGLQRAVRTRKSKTCREQ